MSDLGVTFHCDAEVVAAEGARNNVHIYRDGRVVLSLPFLAVLPGAGSGPGLVIATAGSRFAVSEDPLADRAAMASRRRPGGAT